MLLFRTYLHVDDKDTVHFRERMVSVTNADIFTCFQVLNTFVHNVSFGRGLSEAELASISC